MSSLIQIAQLLKNTGGRFIVVKDGEPLGVLLSVEDYEQLVSSSAHPGEKIKQKEKAEPQFNPEKTGQGKEKIEPLNEVSQKPSSREEEIYFEEVNPFEDKGVNQEIINF